MKATRTFRLGASLLALLLLLPFCAACSDQNAPGSDTTAPSATAAATDAPVATEEDTSYLYDKDGYLKDAIPESLRYDGTEIRQLVWSDDSTAEFTVKETNGTLLNDAVYERNGKVESRLGVHLTEVGTPGNSSNRNNYLETATASAAAGGADVFDLYAGYSMSTTLCAYNGLCVDLRNFPVIDFEKPWWPGSLLSEAAVCGRIYFATGDITPSLINNLYGLFFNKAILTDYNIGDPYAHIENNSWTLEELMDMCAAVGTDLNAASPVYGISFPSKTYTDSFFFAADLRTTDHGENGTIILSEKFNSDRTEQLTSTLREFLHTAPVALSDSKIALFTAGSTLFSMITLNYGKYLADTAFAYGIAPVPKYTADQENYCTCVSNAHTMYAVTSSAASPEAAAATMECLASEGYRQITPALFEITMKTKYAGEYQASVSFGIIRETACFDFGRINSSSFGNLTYSLFRNNVTGTDNTSFGTAFKASASQLEQYVKEVNETYARIAAN